MKLNFLLIKDEYIVTHDLNIKELRENAITSDLIEDDNIFKPKPPGFFKRNVWARLNNILVNMKIEMIYSKISDKLTTLPP